MRWTTRRPTSTDSRSGRWRCWQAHSGSVRSEGSVALMQRSVRNPTGIGADTCARSRSVSAAAMQCPLMPTLLAHVRHAGGSSRLPGSARTRRRKRQVKSAQRASSDRCGRDTSSRSRPRSIPSRPSSAASPPRTRPAPRLAARARRYRAAPCSRARSGGARSATRSCRPRAVAEPRCSAPPGGRGWGSRPRWCPGRPPGSRHAARGRARPRPRISEGGGRRRAESPSRGRARRRALHAVARAMLRASRTSAMGSVTNSTFGRCSA